MNKQVYILGAGITGLAAGLASGLPVFEAAAIPGGICSSYYIRPGSKERLSTLPADGEAYHFELGGGHWIFGGDPAVLHFIRSLTPVKTYQRRSSVFFAGRKLYVPYPLQNHLGYLGPDIAAKALQEMLTAPQGNPQTMADTFTQNFGPTLTEQFFGPFHQLYTAGLWTRIAPQDGYKSPVNISLALQGAFGQTPPVGYNVTFVYPEAGLNTLAQRMGERCKVHYDRQVAQIDAGQKAVYFADGSRLPYDALISTLPLNKTLAMAGLTVVEPADPYTSVSVLNIGAVRGPRCPSDHWLYNPDTQAGFHRVGFYSNVDSSFLPQSARLTNNRVSIYVERAYPGGEQPAAEALEIYAEAVVKELQAWEFIGEAEVVDPTWVEVAYTWSWSHSQWRNKALKYLEEHHIFQVGRYGRWIFQGIARLYQGWVCGRGCFQWKLMSFRAMKEREILEVENKFMTDNPQSPPSVVAVIVTWNKRAEVLRCIESVLASTRPLQAVVVVDNASTDDTAAVVKERFGQRIHLIVNPSNQGGSGGFYQGIAVAFKYQPEYLWLLDNDIIVAPEALAELLRIATQEPQAGIVGSKVYFAQAPQVIWSMGARVNHRRAKISIVGDKTHDYGQFDQLVEVDYVPLCSMLLAVPVIAAIGSVDPAYFVYCDDLDFCTRTKRAGFRVLNAPGSIVWHDITLSSSRMSPFALYYYTRNYIYYFLKFAPTGAKLITITWLLVFMLKRLLATVRYWPGFAMFIRLEQAALMGGLDGWRAKRGKVY